MSLTTYRRNVMFPNSGEGTLFERKETHAKTAEELQKCLKTVTSFAGYKNSQQTQETDPKASVQESDPCAKAIHWLTKAYEKCQTAPTFYKRPSATMSEKQEQAPTPKPPATLRLGR